jgi:transcription initiation factor TFIID subunit 11
MADFGFIRNDKESESEDDVSEDELYQVQKQVNPPLPEAEMKRFEIFKRSHLQKKDVKKMVNNLMSAQMNNNTVIVVSSCAKLFIAELTEIAREIMTEKGETGSIDPQTLREAYFRYMGDKKTDLPRFKKSLF